MDKKLRMIVIAGVMGGISIFLGATHLGFIPYFSGASLTIMQVPVIIGAVLEGPIVGLATGFIFGIFSLIQSAVAPSGPADVWFVNPIVSVLPRLFIGPVAWLVYRAVRNFREVPAYVGAGIAGSLTNTVLVLGVLGLYRYLPWKLIGTIAVANGLPEAVLSAVLTTAVMVSWRKIETKRGGSSI